MSFPSHRFRVRFRLVAGCVLLIAGFFGVLHARNAGRAERLYLLSRYGFHRGTRYERPASDDLAVVAPRARLAASLYPRNYYFPSYAAFCALAEARDAPDRESFDDAMRAALYFSRNAYALNPYDHQARLSRVQALAESGHLAEAFEFWAPVLRREFWNRSNHDVQARLLLQEGSTASLRLAVRERGLVEDPELRKRLNGLARALDRTRRRKGAAGNKQ